MLPCSRHSLELTQKERADGLGIPQNHISEMENGKLPIGKRIALRLGKFFNTDYRKFL
jgi:plasmid maintenance system antidote protein VapI